MDLKTAQHVYDTVEYSETCTWYGTEWAGEGKDSCLLPCGEPTIGRGLFEDPIGKFCAIHDLCERHANRQTESWED